MTTSELIKLGLIAFSRLAELCFYGFGFFVAGIATHAKYGQVVFNPQQFVAYEITAVFSIIAGCVLMVCRPIFTWAWDKVEDSYGVAS